MALAILRSCVTATAGGLRFATVTTRRRLAVEAPKVEASHHLETQRTYLPFHVFRAHTNNLPVYSKIRYAGTKHVTVIRHAVGDIQALKKEIHMLLGPDIEIKEYVGRLEIKGRHNYAVKQWLRILGF